MCRNAPDVNDGCRCRGGRLRGFIQPRLLLQLAKKSAHGYELMAVVSEEDELGTDPGNLYRTLRAMEEDGLVSSNWDTTGGGPARRMYHVTDHGVDHLHTWMASIRKTRQALDDFLREYESQFPKERNAKHVSAL